MQYTEALIEEYIQRWGEVWVVLDSDREYQLHGLEHVEFDERDGDTTVAQVEGMQDDEWVKVEFDLADVEHVYTHREV